MRRSIRLAICSACVGLAAFTTHLEVEEADAQAEADVHHQAHPEDPCGRISAARQSKGSESLLASLSWLPPPLPPCAPMSRQLDVSARSVSTSVCVSAEGECVSTRNGAPGSLCARMMVLDAAAHISDDS